jgi:hypothetical protein
VQATTNQRNRELFARTWKLLAVVVVSQLCDLSTFLMGIARVGIEAESNPLVRHLYEAYGAAGPLLLKLGTMGTILPLLWFVAARYNARILAPTFLAVSISLIGIYGNFAHGITR